jgi:hypothetical protein
MAFMCDITCQLRIWSVGEGTWHDYVYEWKAWIGIYTKVRYVLMNGSVWKAWNNNE